MIPYVYAIDEIFPEYEFKLLHEYAMRLEYKDQEGPDGVVYKGIGMPVPEAAQERLTVTLSWLLGYKIVLKICAFRLSTEGTEPPQWAHSDAQVSRFAAFVYMNPGPGGTVLLKHRELEFDVHPRNDAELEAWKKDHSTTQAWEIRAAIDCVPNRIVVMRSELIHAAMPPRGFGQSQVDGRLILWSFFD